jgi:hypothetical protein
MDIQNVSEQGDFLVKTLVRNHFYKEFGRLCQQSQPRGELAAAD